MTQPPLLTDRKALDRNRQRASTAPVLFLQETAGDDVQERLEAVNRAFTDPIIISPWPSLWSRIMPNAPVIPDRPTLDLEPESHDLVIHALSLHWADDPVGQLVQCRRALRPDGLFIATLFAGQTLNELRTALAQAESRVSGGLSPRVLPMGEVRDLGGLLQRAGFALPVADSLPLTASYRDIVHLMHDLRLMGEGNALAARHKSPIPRPVLAEAQRIYAKAFPAEDGRIRATFDIITLTGWAPSETQQKPLRPGSAQTRLAQALGTDELPLDPTGD